MNCPVHGPFDATGLAVHAAGVPEAYKDVQSRRQPFFGPMTRKAVAAREKMTSAALEAVRGSRIPDFAIQGAQDAIRRNTDGVREMMRDIFRMVGRRFSRDGFRAVRSESSLSLKQDEDEVVDRWFDEVERFLQQEGGQDIRRITETTREDIVDILTEARRDGAGIEEMAQILDEEIDAVNQRRGRVIARTETITASNKASQFGAKQTGLTLEKRWVDSDDARVRRSHREVDGQQVPIDDPYVWTSPESGRVQAAFPGDPSLPAAERIQCRCVEIHEPA
jgi:hypothetical protein